MKRHIKVPVTQDMYNALVSRAYYQRLDTTQHRYMRGVEYRRERELDMMKHDYTEHSTKEYQSRQLYGPGKKNKKWTRVFK